MIHKVSKSMILKMMMTSRIIRLNMILRMNPDRSQIAKIQVSLPQLEGKPRKS
jgi:hypothetical protein